MIPAPLELDVEEPSNFSVHMESTRSARSTSLTPPGTSCEIDELSSPGNYARRSAMAWLLIVVGVSVIISY